MPSQKRHHSLAPTRHLSRYNDRLFLFVPSEKNALLTECLWAKKFFPSRGCCVTLKMLQTPLKMFQNRRLLDKDHRGRGKALRSSSSSPYIHPVVDRLRCVGTMPNRPPGAPGWDWYDDEPAVQHLSQRARPSVRQSRDPVRCPVLASSSFQDSCIAGSSD